MKFKDKWLAFISIGEQTFRTDTSDQTNRLSKNNLIGYCEIDIFEFLSRVSDSDIEVFDFPDPSSSNVVDYNGDGKLSFSEFSELIKAFGNQMAAEKVVLSPYQLNVNYLYLKKQLGEPHASHEFIRSYIGKLGVLSSEENRRNMAAAAAAAAIALLPARKALPATMMNLTRRMNVKPRSSSILSVTSCSYSYSSASKKQLILYSKPGCCLC
ncbi:hypothetical protein LXL04_009966 [Taraxacum kok-saghyz]